MVTSHSREQVIQVLAAIPDPEIPVVNIIEMGMLRDVQISEAGYEVIITPTYSGCPAMSLIDQLVRLTLEANGIKPVRVKMVYDPAWTTDWMTEEAKEKLRKYGIAPPLHSSCNHEQFESNVITCPRCGSTETEMISRFGSTACKSLYKCKNCKEPFEYFKCH